MTKRISLDLYLTKELLNFLYDSPKPKDKIVRYLVSKGIGRSTAYQYLMKLENIGVIQSHYDPVEGTIYKINEVGKNFAEVLNQIKCMV
jgi:DNA-binding PadR family transcriptional regulator